MEGADIDLSATVNEFPALLCEFKTDIATYLETYTADGYPKTLADLIAFNQAHPELEGPWNDLVFELAEETNGRGEDCAALREATTPPVQAAIDSLMADNDLDAIIGLTNGPAWVTNSDPDFGDLDGHFEFFVGSSGAAAVSGYADITVPAGYVEGLPIGITFIAGRWSEPELIGFAYDFEQATRCASHRRSSRRSGRTSRASRARRRSRARIEPPLRVGVTAGACRRCGNPSPLGHLSPGID